MNWYMKFSGLLKEASFRRRYKTAQGDPTYNIRLMMEEKENGLVAQMSKLKSMPAIRQFWTTDHVQKMWVALSGAVDGVMRVIKTANDYEAAKKNLKSAYKIMNELIGEISRLGVPQFAKEPAVRTFFTDLKDVYSELQKVSAMRKQPAPQAQPAQPQVQRPMPQPRQTPSPYEINQPGQPASQVA